MDMTRTVSTLLSPTFVATYVTVIFSIFSVSTLSGILISLSLGFLFLGLIPTASIYYFSRKGYADIDYTEKEKRGKVYLVAFCSYLISASIFLFLKIHSMFLISVAYLCVVSAISFINMFWKISAHSAGVAGPITALVYVFGYHLLPLYLLTLVVMWCRLKMGIHDLKQLIAGALIAIFITFIVYKILW
jgi:membrane-associated phospholipid phosphatase